MKFSTSLIIVLIAVTLTTSTILPAYAEGRSVSVFQKIEQFSQEPFLSMEKAVGGDGHKRPHSYQQQEKLKPFLSSWICQMVVGDIGKLTDASSQDVFTASSWCKGTL